MANLATEIKSLQEKSVLPSLDYISKGRFFTPYEQAEYFVRGVFKPIMWPLLNVAWACYYTLGAAWAALRIVGNLLICSPKGVANACCDLSIYTLLTIAPIIMAPIDALSSTIELFTRTLACWISTSESADRNSSTKSFSEKWIKQTKKINSYLPSMENFKQKRFLTPNKNVGEFLNSLTTPFTSIAFTAVECLSQALRTIDSALGSIVNTIICQPREVQQSLYGVGVHLSLTVALAIMTPINACLEAIASITRLVATTGTACFEKPSKVVVKSDPEDSNDLPLIPVESYQTNPYQASS